MGGSLDRRVEVDFDQYEALLQDGGGIRFGTKDTVIDLPSYSRNLAAIEGAGKAVLTRVSDFHREYAWV